MRPLSKGPQPADYAPPKNLRFTGMNGLKVRQVLGTDNPPLSACLAVWLRIVKARKRRPNWYAALAEVAKLIQGRVDEIYKDAAADLIASLGEYCSYCESPITGLLEVEHVLPKAEYPTYATDWENFLLACGPCNTCKGDMPSRLMVSGWVGSQVTNEAQCRDEVRRRYIWPDIYPQVYRFVSFKMIHDPTNNGNWQVVPFKKATHLKTRLVSVDIPTRTVRADIPSLKLRGVRVVVRVVPRDSPIGRGTARRWVTPAGTQEIIDLCGLNTTRSARVAYDRRGLHRTRAWFEALDSLKMLRAMRTPATFNLAWQQVGRTATRTGFFSVWLHVFSSAIDPSGTRLDQRFVSDFANLFPGTDTTLLP